MIIIIMRNVQHSTFHLIVSSEGRVKCDGVLANVLFGDNNIEESYQR